MLKVRVDTSSVPAAVDKTLMKIKMVQAQTLDVIGKEEVQATKQRITMWKADPKGRAWAPWALSTMRARRRQGNASRGLLYATGRLLNSIQYHVRNGVLTVFSDDNKASFLQKGTPNMPAREFLGFGTRLNSIIDKIRKALQ